MLRRVGAEHARRAGLGELRRERGELEDVREGLGVAQDRLDVGVPEDGDDAEGEPLVGEGRALAAPARVDGEGIAPRRGIERLEGEGLGHGGRAYREAAASPQTARGMKRVEEEGAAWTGTSSARSRRRCWLRPGERPTGRRR